MPVPRIEDIRPRTRRHGAGSRLWAEWCFVRVCLRHVRVRLLLMAIVLAVGATLFHTVDRKPHSVIESTFYTFSLVFGEPPDQFPTTPVLQVLYFVVPILGLTIIIEGIVDFSLVLRDRRRFEKSWCIMLASSFRNHIVLVGLGRLGYRTFLTLRRLGEAVVVVEADPEGPFLEEVRRDGSPILIGDGRQDALLEEANIAAARSVVIATNDDLTNLEIALDARKLNPDIRVVLRMYDQNMADKVADGFNIRLAMSETAIASPTFATCAVAPATVNSYIVGDEVVAMQRWLVRNGGPFDGRTIAEMMRAHGIGVVELRCGGDCTLWPDPDRRLAPGDGILVQGTIEVLQSLRRDATAMTDETAEAPA
jgi:Trk K+ transport system NAD-binding subunit